jgi:hypothetical protein
MMLAFLGLYMALAAIFYLRLTATATDGTAPKITLPSNWHRARRLTKAFVRRVRTALPKHF